MVLRSAAAIYNLLPESEELPLAWLAPLLDLTDAIDACVASGVMHVEPE